MTTQTVSEVPRRGTTTASVAKRIDRAAAAVGKGADLSGGCSEDYHEVVVLDADREVALTTTGPWPRCDLPITTAHTSESLRAWRLLMTPIGLAEASLDLAIQRWLRRLGHYGQSWLLDGRFGPESVSALQRFLTTKGLYLQEADGWRGPLTIRAEIRYLNDQRHFW